jgi:hypothetical protein
MNSQKVGVYINSDTIQYHFSKFQNPQNIDIVKDVNVFSSYARRIAALHVPYPFDFKFEQQVKDLANTCEHVFVVTTEVHPEIVRFIRNTDIANVTYYVCGFVNFPLQNARIYPYMDWFETSTYFYRHYLPELLSRLKPFEPKYRAFDILLGRKKQHRDFVYNCIRKDPAVGIYTYFTDENTKFSQDPNQWRWELTGMIMNKIPEWTIDHVDYYGHNMSVSQIIPINIYNQTAYSVIAETCWRDNFAFFTEKTAKPIIAKRLFVMFAGAGYLANLRKLGFRTFGDVIDESYDTETDALIRWQLAWDQVKWLSEQPQSEILERIRPTVEHNAEVMLTTDWHDLFLSQFEQDFARITAD